MLPGLLFAKGGASDKFYGGLLALMVRSRFEKDMNLEFKGEEGS